MLEIDPGTRGDHFARHDVANLFVEPPLEAQIAIRQDARPAARRTTTGNPEIR